MTHLLFWYLSFLIGGLALQLDTLRCLSREVACLLRLTRKPRIYPTVPPLLAITLSFGILIFGTIQYLLNITLIWPLGMGVAWLLTRITGRPKRARIRPECVGRNWHYYDGTMYVLALGGFAAEMAEKLNPFIPDGGDLLDLCCGPGLLSLHFAAKCRRVVGLDHALGMIRYAEKQRQKQGLNHVSFVHGDATDLSAYADGEFDVALISMALHEMPFDVSLAALTEAKRVAKRVIIVDYAAPLPRHLPGMVFRYLEFIAGFHHLRGFLRYQRHGGLDFLLERCDLQIVRETDAMQRSIRIVEVQTAV